MKSNNIKFLLFGLGLLLTTQSCNKFLDKEPDNRTEINTVSKVAQLVATAYPTADYYTFTEAASDNAEDKGNNIGSVSDVSSLPYFWEDVLGNETGTSTSYWNGCYEGISAANQALEAIEKGNFGNDVLPYKGEALVARAYAHFMLVTFFSKAYVIDGANDSPGIPYVTSPETVVIKQYDRGTVKSTYEKIEKDLTEGMALLSGNAYSVPRYHFTPAAAHAFASRFYLFTGAWQKAIDHASLSVPAGDFLNNLRPINTTLRLLGNPEFQIAFSRSDQKSNLLIANQYSAYPRLTSPRFGYGIKLTGMFGTMGNITGKALANKVYPWVAGSSFGTIKWKEYFYKVSQNADTGFPYIMSVLLSVDEALMNRAEAYARLGLYDKALADVNTFLSVRINGYSPSADAVTLAKINTYYGITDPKEGVIKLILDSKKAEFLQEGIRWLDIVRTGMTVRHNVYDANGVEGFIELGPNDNRRVFQIPQEATLSGVQLNPR